jgi:hypothetical protein
VSGNGVTPQFNEDRAKCTKVANATVCMLRDTKPASELSDVACDNIAVVCDQTRKHQRRRYDNHSGSRCARHHIGVTLSMT